jgi:hypothetical protein
MSRHLREIGGDLAQMSAQRRRWQAVPLQCLA